MSPSFSGAKYPLPVLLGICLGVPLILILAYVVFDAVIRWVR